MHIRYFYVVTALYADGESAPSNMVSATVTSVASAPAAVPTAFSLEQNYPNPFNPTTRIEYTLPETSQVTLNVFDVRGRVVQVLVNQRQSAGRYRVVFDSRGLPAGVYFYRLRAGDFVHTRKMALVR